MMKTVKLEGKSSMVSTVDAIKFYELLAVKLIRNVKSNHSNLSEFLGLALNCSSLLRVAKFGKVLEVIQNGRAVIEKA